MAMIRLPALLLAACAVLPAPAVAAERILFVGNSFTYGANSAVWKWQADSVDDRYGDGVGGVPALVQAFARQSGLDWQVALATGGGRSLAWHLAERRDRIAGAWDQVVLQDYSTLDAERPGDPRATRAAVATLARLFRAANPDARLWLNATWSRPDLTYRPGSPWSGRDIGAMALDVRRALDGVARAGRGRVAGVIPVGQGFTCAVRSGEADANPYDGRDAGTVELWSWDAYHATAHGSYLAALILFGRLSGLDPAALGRDEEAARELGIAPGEAAALQRVAARTLATDGACGA